MKIKRTSKPKLSSQKNLNMTVTGRMYQRQQRQLKLPPLQSTMRRTSNRLIKKQEPIQQRKQTQTTLTQSSMFRSFYLTNTQKWIKPSDYIKDIKQINLIGEEQSDISRYQIKLNEGNVKNLQKIQALFCLVQKWVNILKKALSYTTSEKSSTDKLFEEIKFWKVLSKKFDELQYEFNDKKMTELVSLMTKIVKTSSEYKKIFQQFIVIREKVINKTHSVKRIYLSLQETVHGMIQKLQQNSDIEQSLILLKKILISFQMIYQEQPILQFRIEIIYNKIELCAVQKLLSAPLYPHQLAKISSLKDKYLVIDRSLSFYSQLISVIEQYNKESVQKTIERAQFTRNVLVNLLQILSYFEFLFNKKQIYEFSKLSTNNLSFNIYELENSQLWNQYMEKVHKSMQIYNFQS